MELGGEWIHSKITWRPLGVRSLETRRYTPGDCLAIMSSRKRRRTSWQPCGRRERAGRGWRRWRPALGGSGTAGHGRRGAGLALSGWLAGSGVQGPGGEEGEGRRGRGGGREGRGRGGLWDARRTSNCSSVSRVNSYSSSAESMSGFTKLLAALRCCRVSRRLLPPPRPPAPRPDPPLSLRGGMSRPAAVREYSAVLFTAWYTTMCRHLILSLPHSPPLLPW